MPTLYGSMYNKYESSYMYTFVVLLISISLVMRLYGFHTLLLIAKTVRLFTAADSR